MWRCLTFTLLCVLGLATAQKGGETVYNQQGSSCHGVSGEGGEVSAVTLNFTANPPSNSHEATDDPNDP